MIPHRFWQGWFSHAPTTLLFLLILAIVFCSETLVMFALTYLLPDGHGTLPETLLDASLLGVMAAAGVLPLLIRFRNRAAAAEVAINITREGYWVIGRDGRFLDVNAGYCRMVGFGRTEILSMRIADLEAHAPEQDIEAHLERTVAQGYDRFETRHRHREGHLIDLEMTISYLPQLRRFVVFLRDITERKRIERELLITQTAIEKSQSAFYRVNAAGRVLYANDYACQSLGYTREELLSMHVWQFDPNFPPEAWTPMWEGLRHTKVVNTETQHRRKDGTIFPVEIIGNVVNTEEEGEYSFVFVHDITKRKRNEHELRIAAFAFETQEGMIVTDAETKILRVNLAFTRLTGYSAEEAIGQTPALLQSGRQDSEFYRQMWNTLSRDKYWQGEMWTRRKNGEIYPEWLTITAVTDAEGQVTNYIGAFSDITQRKQDEAEIHNLAFYDPLTGLPNRRLLHDRLQHAFAVSARHRNHIALLFIDLDNFKTLNDTRGHNIGDLLLMEVAKRLQACVREEDTAARLGGDEFVVILEDLDKKEEEAAAQAEAVGKKILDAISQPYTLHEQEYNCTASIGISLFCRNDDTNVDEVLKRADSAMYQAKNAGRNTLRFFDPAVQLALEARTALESDLHRALAEDQFRLYYQMQVDHGGHILGAEVLLRWQHPQHGLVMPLEFIPLAEETGLILPIGQWVMETACTQLKTWESDPLTRNLQLAVNVSARQFRQPDFVEQVYAVLEKTTIEPSLLKLELTESLVLDNIDDTIVKMHKLRKVGVRFSMDDFGTGYSSLSYLTQLPLDQLKIDQSFVRNIGVKHSDGAIVQTIIGMAGNLGMEVIAEGVETEEQRAFLEQHGCLACQGYLFGRPVPVEGFEARLKSS